MKIKQKGVRLLLAYKKMSIVSQGVVIVYQLLVNYDNSLSFGCFKFMEDLTTVILTNKMSVSFSAADTKKPLKNMI